MSDAKKPLPAGLRPETLAVRAGTDRSHHGEHSEAHLAYQDGAGSYSTLAFTHKRPRAWDSPE